MKLFKKKEKKEKLVEEVEVLHSIDIDANKEFVKLDHINKVYPNGVQAVFDFNLDIAKHEFIVLVGPSGCGKSTTLRMIAGLEDITTGNLYIDGIRANSLSPKDRDIALVFQSYALYPHMNVEQNIGFGLKMRKVPKDEIKERVKKAAQILEIDDYLDRKPAELSGGQRQRVALGRAIVRDAKLFLMDEPLSNLDAKLRVQMRSEIVKLHRKINATTIYVTHDQTEAMTMADRIVIMRHGYVQQIGTPKEIYTRPNNVFVATFIGSPATNIIKVKYDDGEITLGEHKLKLSAKFKNAHDEFYLNANFDYLEKVNRVKAEISKLESLKKRKEKEEKTLKQLKERLERYTSNNENYQLAKEGKPHYIYFGVRPEDIHRETEGEVNYKKSKDYPFTITLSELLGNVYSLHFNIGEKEVVAEVMAEDKIIKENDVLNLHFDLDKVHLFDILSENIII